MIAPTLPGSDPVHPILVAWDAAVRAQGYLDNAWGARFDGAEAEVRHALESAHGAALALLADVRDALGALDVHEMHLSETESELRAAWGDR